MKPEQPQDEILSDPQAQPNATDAKNRKGFEDKQKQVRRALFNGKPRKPKVSLSRRIVRGIAVGAVGMDALYTPFLVSIIPHAVDDAAKAFGREIPPEVLNYVRYCAAPLALFNLINDMTSVDPVGQADGLTDALRGETPPRSKKLLTVFIFTIAIQLFSTLTSHPAGASADGIPLTDLITQNIDNKTLATHLRYGALGLTVFLGTLFYVMFTNDRIKRHVSEFIDTMQDPVGFLGRMYQHPKEYLETFMQSLITAGYRGISFAFFAKAAANAVFPYLPAKYVTYGSAITGLSTAILSVLTRTLSVRDVFLHSDYDHIPPEVLAKATGWGKTFIVDFFLSVIRGGAVAVLLDTLLPPPVGYVDLVTTVGAISVTWFTASTRYQARRKQNALESIPKETLENLRKEKQPKVQATLADEATPLISKGKERVTPDQRKLQHYKAIVAEHQLPRFSISFILVTVVITQLLRSISFYSFANDVNAEFGSELNELQLAALAVLLATMVAVNNIAVFRDALNETWVHYDVRCALLKAEAQAQQIENPNQNRSWYGRFYQYAQSTKPGRFIQAALTGPTDFSEKVLENAAPRKIIEVVIDEEGNNDNPQSSTSSPTMGSS